MPQDNVVFLNAVVVYAEVCVEFVGLSINATLPFGPFETVDDAKMWANILVALYAEKHSVEVALAETIHEEKGLPTRPYADVHLSGTFIAQNVHARKLAKFLLPPVSPEEAEAHLGSHALDAAYAMITIARSSGGDVSS